MYPLSTSIHTQLFWALMTCSGFYRPIMKNLFMTSTQGQTVLLLRFNNLKRCMTRQNFPFPCFTPAPYLGGIRTALSWILNICFFILHFITKRQAPHLPVLHPHTSHFLGISGTSSPPTSNQKQDLTFST